MNDEIAQRLAALRPAAWPVELASRMAAPPVKAGKIRWLWTLAPLGAAALWLLILPLASPPAIPGIRATARLQTAAATSSTTQPADLHVYLPVTETSTLVRVEDVALVHPVPDHPVRLVRATWIEDVTYAGDDGRSTMHRRQPRQEIIPVSMEVY